MTKLAFTALTVAALFTAPAMAAPCRDAHGKFIKCAAAKPSAATRCKDAKGKFAKCSAAGAKPIH